MKNTIYTILKQPGQYGVRIYSDTNRTSRIDASISIHLYGEYNLPPPTFANRNIGGIRVSQMKYCPQDDAKCIARIFDYNDNEGFSTGRLYTNLLVRQSHKWRTILSGNIQYYKEIYTSLSNPFRVLNPSHGTLVFYRRIRETNGGLGAMETEFSFPIEDIHFTYPRMPRGVDLDKSLLAVSRVFKKEGNLNTLLQENKSTYQQTKTIRMK